MHFMKFMSKMAARNRANLTDRERRIRTLEREILTLEIQLGERQRQLEIEKKLDLI